MEKKNRTENATKKASQTAEAKRRMAINCMKEIAVNCYTLTDVCEKANVEMRNFENWCKKNPKLKEEIKSLLKKNFKVRKQEFDNGEKEITFTYADIVKDGSRYTDEDKRKIVDMICYAVENGIPINHMCQQLNFPVFYFFRWANPEHVNHYPYASEKYAEAKKTRRIMINDMDVFTARTKLQSRLENREVTNTTLHYETRGANGENEILKGKTVHKRTLEADLPAISLVLNNLDSDFNKKMLTQEQIDGEEFVNMNAEQLREELEKERARRELLDSGNFINEEE